MAIPEAMQTKALAQLITILKGLQEFQREPGRVTPYAEAMVAAMGKNFPEKESFRDQLMGLLANIRNLDGELTKLEPETLATMKPEEILSKQQRRDRNRFLRKRTREQIVYDSTSMLCTTCKLVRPDRLNLNHLGLDSEENGTQFDYNFDNLCQCSHESSDDVSSTSHSSDTKNSKNSSNDDDND